MNRKIRSSINANWIGKCSRSGVHAIANGANCLRPLLISLERKAVFRPLTLSFAKNTSCYSNRVKQRKINNLHSIGPDVTNSSRNVKIELV
jgi:hypothetical protein